MNDTGAAVQDGSPGLLADTVGLLTAANLIVIGLLMALVVIGILYGARLKRRRVAADEKVEAHAEAAGVEVASPPPVDTATPPVSQPAPRAVSPHAVPSSPPVAPSPPPLESEAPPAPSLADEPIAAAAPLEANPAVEAESAPAPAGDDPADQPVTLLKGLGPKVAARLADLGITRVGQIAALDEEAAMRLDAQLGNFTGRMARDRWIEQARFLAVGDRAGFEAVFGKL